MLFYRVVHKLFICRSCWIEAPSPWMKPAGCEPEARCINKRQASSLSMAATFSSNTLRFAIGHARYVIEKALSRDLVWTIFGQFRHFKLRRSKTTNLRSPVQSGPRGVAEGDRVVMPFRVSRCVAAEVLAGADHKTNEQIIEEALKPKKGWWPPNCIIQLTINCPCL